MFYRWLRTLKNKTEQKRTPIDEPEKTPKPKRTHYTKTEIETIQGLIDEGFSNREIATKTNRTTSGIRNLRRRLGLTQKAQDETLPLQEVRDSLEREILELEPKLRETQRGIQDLEARHQANIRSLKNKLQAWEDSIRKAEAKHQTLQSFINVDKTLLEQKLAESLQALKLSKPDLFTLSPDELKFHLVTAIMKGIIDALT